MSGFELSREDAEDWNWYSAEPTEPSAPETSAPLDRRAPAATGERSLASTESETSSPVGARVIRVSDVEAEVVEWLWWRRLPLGKLTMLDGDPGLGKSTVTLDLAARLSTGRAMPGEVEAGEPRDTLLLSAEDGAGDTVRPRLEAAGADLDRVHVFEAVPDGSAWRQPEIPYDAEWIEQAIEQLRVSLVIIDPLFAYLGGRVDARADHHVRRALAPLAAMADRTHAAVLLVRHLNKSAGGPAIYRGGGSIGLIGAVRSGMLLANDPDDSTRRVIAQTKSNLGPIEPALALRLVAQTSAGVAHVEWEGPTPHVAGDLLRLVDDDARTAADDAKAFLLDALGDGRAHDSSELKAQAKTDGISARTLQRAFKELGGLPVRGGYQAPTTWSLPESQGRRATDPGMPSETEPLAQLAEPLSHAGSPAPKVPLNDQSRHTSDLARLEAAAHHQVPDAAESASELRPRDAGMYGPRAPA